MAQSKRKGAKSKAEIPQTILAKLNRGELETANLVEWLAIDQMVLLRSFLETIDRMEYFDALKTEIERLQKQTINTINQCIGKGLYILSIKHQDKKLFSELTKHTSDSVRCWACYFVAADERTSLHSLLEQTKPFAADPHFGVREIAWLAARPRIAKELHQAIKVLEKWALHHDENIRRFASEATRPRGVWCEHIETLKQKPEIALKILTPLKSDSSKYVQDSVGNWLNDAAKTQPAFVKQLCKQWEKESKTKETAYIIKKALRSI